MNRNKTNSKPKKTTTSILFVLVLGCFLIALANNFDAFLAGFKSMF
ncbi:hypothetical protein DI53_0696 [Sphingobacterium deserti]|uniref:Uncharacterized protein n=1 Tax=Sphingobacterium deserti TaxID=1229276 RepID=A0A0B8T2M4_9SPHI|nr:hypothetical protein DI53_0696 [Sphingobacterium deserti]